ncbi:MAG: type II toxin-antitoxin system VapC family toxin [Candidatus Njordarchaeia archaeon]
MIVIDSSAFAKFLLGEKNWETIANILKSGEDIYSVDLLSIELTNVIWKYLVLYKRITVEQAKALYEQMNKLINKKVIILKESKIYLREAFRISCDANISIYDSLFLAMAKILKARLITSDKKQYKLGLKLNLDAVYIS